MKKAIIISSFLALFLISACNRVEQRSFAVVIDQESYRQAQSEIASYMESIKKDGLLPILVIDKWQHPDSIRAELIKLYKTDQNPIEGAVFIGDIPIAMLRDAQHLSSAFKMKQSDKNYQRSSIPSDRFYDDFDLTFDYIKQDTTNQLLHYYSLKNNSSQFLCSEIYTARIKPFDTDHKYEDLKKYLTKVVKVKSEENSLNQVLFFAGHGYNSDEIVVRVDENEILKDQLNCIKNYEDDISFINHDMDNIIKGRLLGEIQRDNLDLAIFHHHGGDDAEYLNSYPIPGNTEENIEAIKIYVRSKLNTAKRRNKDVEEAKKYYCETLDIPTDWFDDAFSPEILKKDSILNADMDIHIDDIHNTTSNVRMLVLDACFNGSFQLDQYIAGTYIFNDGKTVVVQANSVNSLQDKWSTEFIGLLGMGMRFGAWSKYEAYLETHVFGDPTFHLASANKINTEYHNTSTKYWTKMLNAEEPSLQALAIRKLYESNEPGFSTRLLEIYKTSPHPSVRNEALRMLTAYNDNNFIECLKLAMKDPIELIRRSATYLAGYSGNPGLASAVVQTAIKNNLSKRVGYAAREALGSFNSDLLHQKFDSLFKEINYSDPVQAKEKCLKTIDVATRKVNERIEEILNPKTAQKWIKSDIRSLRNSPDHEHIEELCEFLLNKVEDNATKITLIEAFGWYNISYKKQLIIETCKKIADDANQSKAVKDEANKTINRLSEPWYK